MKNKYYINERVLISKSLKVGTIVKIHEDGIRLLVSYYDDKNNFIHTLITPDDIMTPEQYEIMKVRNHTLLDIIK